MESQLPRSYGHHYEQESHIQPAAEDEHHHDKNPMLGKVKEKAKKIKNTLKKHGHGHDHDHAHDHSQDEDDDGEDEEIVQDPEIHVYDSTTVSSTQTPRTAEFDSGLHKGNLEKPSVMKEDRYESMFEKSPVRTSAQWEPEDKKSRDKPDDQDVSFPVLRANAGVPGENLGVTMEEDTNAPGKDRIFGAPSNYETKVADSTGRGEETGVTPILHSLDKMGIYDEHQSKPNLETNQNQGRSSTGMYDELHNILGTKQNLRKTTGTHDKFSPMLHDEPRNKQGMGANQSLGPTTGSHDQFSPVIHDKLNLGTTQAVGSTTGSNKQSMSGIYDEPRKSSDQGAKQNVITSLHSHDQHSPGIFDEPRTDRHVGAKQCSDETTGSHGRFHPETKSTYDSTMKSPDQSSSYTGMISSAASSVTDKAISAKDAVASTLGYGGPVTVNNASHSAQGGGLAAKVTETLSPVYKKVVGAGSAVMSKASPGDDKNGASSVKEYWTEKLKPGEEDKALSEVILGAISANPAREDDIDKRGTREVVSDAVHKRAPDDERDGESDGVEGFGEAVGFRR